MKTILIVVAGMGDLPSSESMIETPLCIARTPSLDTLARRGDLTVIQTYKEKFDVSHKNSLLSLLGYDLERGEPTLEDLMEFGLDGSKPITAYPSLNSFIIPGFSGHGVCITTSAWVRGVGKTALLKPLDIYSPGSSDVEIFETMASLVNKEISKYEFVLVYVDSPLKASLSGDLKNKVRTLEVIDRHLINPIADHVWNSELMINMAITSDLITPWHSRRPALIGVPAILYFNNHDKEGDPERKFTEVEAMLCERYFVTPSDLIRYLCNFSVSEEDTSISN